jgi:hypothetical protein
MRRTSITVVLALATLLFVSTGLAQQTTTTAVPNLIRYGGTLKDAQGAALSSHTAVGVTFSIYRQQDGGAAVWMETQNITPDANGQYSVILGSTIAAGLPGDLFSQQEQRWLGVQVQGEAELARVLLVSVPYAFKAHEAETLGGLPASAFVQAAPSNASGSISSDTGTALNALNNVGTAGRASRTKGKTSAPCATIGGGGALNFIPLWTPDGCTLGDSLMFQDPAATVVNDNGNFNVVAATGSYQIGGNNVLSTSISATTNNLFVGRTGGGGGYNTFSGIWTGILNTTGVANTYLGAYAGYANQSGGGNVLIGNSAGFANTGNANTFVGSSAGDRHVSGDLNTFIGAGAGIFAGTGASNTYLGAEAGAGTQATAAGNNANFNTFIGEGAGQSHVTGDGNTYVGSGAGQQDIGSGSYGFPADGNSFFGFRAGFSNVGTAFGGLGNTFLGFQAGFNNTPTYGINFAGQNTFVGSSAGISNGGGFANTFLGFGAGYYNISGSQNIFIGASAGCCGPQGNNNIVIGGPAETTGNGHGAYNIDIGSPSTGDGGYEWNTIRIGTVDSTGIEGQNAAFIAGIYGHGTSGGGIPVYVSSDGKLGTSASSRRFKEQIADMGDSSSGLFQLRPVTFFYKPQYDDGSHALQYGLIAEEVAKVYPEMVVYDKDGQPYTVKYQLLAPMLLNELQKQHTVVAAQQDVIKTQQQQIEQMQQRLSRLESLIAKR